MQVNFAPYERHGLPCGSSPSSPTNYSQGGLSAAGKRLAELLARVWLNFFLPLVCYLLTTMWSSGGVWASVQATKTVLKSACLQPCEVQVVCEHQSRLQTVENLPAFTCEKPCEVQLVSVLDFRLVCNWLCEKNEKKHTCDHMKVRLECTSGSSIQTHEGSVFF